MTINLISNPLLSKSSYSLEFNVKLCLSAIHDVNTHIAVVFLEISAI